MHVEKYCGLIRECSLQNMLHLKRACKVSSRVDWLSDLLSSQLVISFKCTSVIDVFVHS